MDSDAKFYDPLTINLKRQTARLVELLQTNSAHLNDIRNVRSHTELLHLLSSLLAFPAYTMSIATLFRPLLFDLCARWLHGEFQLEEKFQALCLLIEVHPEIFP